MSFTAELIEDKIVSVNNLKDVIATLAVVHNSYIDREYEPASRKIDATTVQTSQVEVPTIQRVLTYFGISRQAAYNRLAALVDGGYIEKDEARSYWHYANNKTYRTIYKLTTKGKLTLKAHFVDSSR